MSISLTFSLLQCMIKGYCSLNQLKAGGFGQSSYTSLDQLKAPWQTSISPWPFPGLVSFLAAQGWSKDDFRIFNYKVRGSQTTLERVTKPN